MIPDDYRYNDSVLSLIEQAIVASGGAIPDRNGKTWNDRHLQLLDTLASLGGGGVAGADLQTTANWIESGSWTDPGGNHLSGVPSFASNQWTVSLLGGAGTSTTDPLSGAHLIGSALSTDIAGDSLNTAWMWAIVVHLLEISPPASLSADITIAMGILNEDVDSGTIDGSYIGFEYTGGSRRLVKGRLSNGAVASTAGTSSASIRAHQSVLMRQGVATTTWQQAAGARALDANGDALGSVGSGSTTDNTINSTTANPRPFLAVWRTSTTDTTTRSVTFKARRGPITGQAIPTT